MRVLDMPGAPHAGLASRIEKPSSGRKIHGSRHFLVLVLGFLVAGASFVSATMYSDARLADVARRTHEISDNALPSIVAVGAMRRELAHVHYILDESAEGDRAELTALDMHVQALNEARSDYEALPLFPGEADLALRARATLDEVSRLVAKIRPLIDEGRLEEADRLVTTELQPAVRRADAGLADVGRFHELQGRLVAHAADSTWSRARNVALLLDVLCVCMTAAIAYVALRSTRRYERMMATRADELGAFAARVAHDIRGPLSPVLVSLQFAELDLEPDSAKREVLERGVRSVRRINQLIGDLLTFARAGAEPQADAHTSLRAVTTSVVEDLQPLAADEGVRLVCEDLPDCEVACAPGVLTSILLNLVGNAIKHMPDGWQNREVRVRAAVEGRRARVEVADTGAGIPSNIQGRVFDPHVRASTKPGLGLGLATVRRLVTAHGGAVGLRSIEGEGATLWFELPVR